MISGVRGTVACALTIVLTVAGCSSDPGEPNGDDQPNLDAGRSDPVTDPMYSEYGHDDIDVLHYGLNLEYNPDDQQLSGKARLVIRPVEDASQLDLDFNEAMDISKLSVDGDEPEYNVDGWDLTVDTPLRRDKEIEVTVAYSGEPKEIDAPAKRSDMGEGIGVSIDDDSGALWSFQEPYGALTWYPVNEHPSDEALYDIKVTVPDGYAGVASGSFKGQKGNTYSWSSAEPVASYLTTIAVDEFDKIEMTGPHDLPITAWVPPQYDDMRDTAEQLPDMIAWLEERYGRYPFDAAGAVFVGGESAMETQEMVTFSGDLGPRSESVMVHELAHQWFGDSVTPRDWKGLWLSEGPATYIEQLWAAEAGSTDMDEVVKEWTAQDEYLRKSSGPPGDPDAGDFAASNSYVCPALMLHYLGEEIGGADELDEFLKAWVADHENENVTREDFVEFTNEYTGEDFTAFIDEWLDSPTTPK